MIVAAVFLAGVLVGGLLVALVLAVLERDSGAKGYVTLHMSADASQAVEALKRAEHYTRRRTL